jgi:4-amino-4-deoxy-L-arabinose transferase-like glycosyltransferase
MAGDWWPNAIAFVEDNRVSACRTIEPTVSPSRSILSRRALTRFLGIAAIGVLLYVLFFYRLADRDLWSSHEARAAMDAQTVLDGDWRLPHLFDGRAEMQKPPLYYWLVALAAWPRGGVDAWAVRLPAALSALALVLFIGVLAWRRGRPFVGVSAGLILATAVHYPWLARIGRIDMPLSLTTAVAIGCFHLASSSSRRAAIALLFAGYLAAAAGVMFKGPIGFILPASVIAVHQLLEWFLARRSGHSAFRIPHSAFGLWWGLPLIVALTLPWFLWANAQTGGEFFQEFFWRHNVERGLGNGDLRSHPWWLYLPYFANDFLPWSPLLFLALIGCVWRGWWRTDSEMRLGLVWLVVIVGGLSWASFKRGDYLLPAYPGAALFLSCALERWRQEAAGRLKAIADRVPLLLAIVVGCVAAGWLYQVCHTLPAIESYRDYQSFASVIRQQAPAPRPVIFFRTEAHALAFHVGAPLQTLSQWSELDAQLTQHGTLYIVMPPEAATEAGEEHKGIRWEEVSSNVELAGGRHERPLVLMRARR